MPEICILAGGLSTRMGRDKARLRLGGKTLLRRVRDIAAQTPWPARVIRRDAVARCGPLGGVFTALQTTPAESVLFLACDMPFVTVELLETLVKLWTPRTQALFTCPPRGKAGFPFILRNNMLPQVERQLAEQHFSLQTLAMRCRAKLHTVPKSVLINVNTPHDLETARRLA